MKDPDNVRETHAKIEELIRRERPNPEDFRGIIPDSEIDADLAKVAELEKNWELHNDKEANDVKMKADIAEYIIYKNLGTWLNQRAVPLMTAKPDDYLRGIDLLIESEQEEGGGFQHLGIGMDVALASERGVSNAVEKKEKKVRQMLKSGNLTEARYVSGGSYEGRIADLSYTILSVSPSHIEDLFSSVLRKDSSAKEQAHILKYIVAYQIVKQLGTYYMIADNAGKDMLARKYAIANNFANDIFGHLITDLQNNPEIWKKVSQDAGTQEIERFCNELEQEINHA